MLIINTSNPMERSKRSPSGKIGNAIMIAASALTLGACGNNQDSQRLKNLEKVNADQKALLNKMGENLSIMGAKQHMVSEEIQKIRYLLLENSKPEKQAPVSTPVVPSKTAAATNPHALCLTGLANERKTNEIQESRLDNHDKLMNEIAKRLDADGIKGSK